jgi:hypothetical protein
MAYIINKSDGSILLTLQDGDLNVSTSLGLLGRNYTGYGEVQNENFIFLLENFANVNPPARPIKGQTWFDSANNILRVYEGQQWIPVGSATLSAIPPAEVLGSFWLKTTTNQIYVFTVSGWELVGPQGVEGFGKTRAESQILKDTNDVNYAVILFFVNGIVEAICSSTAFTLNSSNSIPGFFNIVKGINISSLSTIHGNLSGNATTATRLETPRTINSVAFNGTSNIVIKADTTNFLRKGDYLLGLDFNGSAERIWSVDASSENFVGKIVARDNAGSFSAQEISAVSFNGTLQGNVNAVSGTSFFNKILSPLIEGQTYTGNAASATRLNPGRFVNGVYFDGTSNITVTANAQTLSGTFINSSVISSSLNTVGTLLNLTINDAGIEIGQGNKLKISTTSANPKISGDNSLDISTDSNLGIKFVGISEAVQVGGPPAPAILSNSSTINIGGPTRKFDKIYANLFVGNSDTATKLQTSRTINGVLFDGTQNIVIVDNTKLPIAGGTVTGNLTVNGRLANNKIPIFSADVVNKEYLDSIIASITSRPMALVRFRGSNGSIIWSYNVNSVARTGNGRYTINIRPGTFFQNQFVAAGMASDVDHFVAMPSYSVGANSAQDTLFITTVDNGSGNDSPSNTAEVTVIMIG